MKLIIAAVLVCIATSAYAGGWCAYYDFGGHDGYRKCGFTLLEQCVWDVRGVGGSCGPSPYSSYPKHRYKR
jgi:hypothetical protein